MDEVLTNDSGTVRLINNRRGERRSQLRSFTSLRNLMNGYTFLVTFCKPCTFLRFLEARMTVYDINTTNLVSRL